MLCENHNKEFRTGHTCPVCAETKPEAAPDAEATAKRRKKKAGLPTLIDHEKWFVSLSDKALAIAEDEGPVDMPELAPSMGERARMFDVAIKARRAAAEMAGKRDEDEVMERLERSALALERAKDNRAGKLTH